MDVLALVDALIDGERVALVELEGEKESDPDTEGVDELDGVREALALSVCDGLIEGEELGDVEALAVRLPLPVAEREALTEAEAVSVALSVALVVGLTDALELDEAEIEPLPVIVVVGDVLQLVVTDGDKLDDDVREACRRRGGGEGSSESRGGQGGHKQMGGGGQILL